VAAPHTPAPAVRASTPGATRSGASATPTASPTAPAATPPTSAAPVRSDADTVLALTVPVERISSGWLAKLTPGGDTVSVSTLDLCGVDYPSEAKRTARRQMVYGASSDDMPVSTEVVTYRDGGAAQAMTELQSAIDHCPGGLVQEKDLHGGMAKYHVSKMLVTSAKWLPGTIAVVVTIDHPDDGTSYTDGEIVQIRGNVLSIVYGPLDGQTISAETMTTANVAAELLGAVPQST
jgi:hypothetical protein